MRRGWAEQSLERLLERVGDTAEQVEERFPLYAETSTGEWRTTRRGSWTGGFWSGLLSLRAAATGSAAHREQARVTWRRLQQWQDKDTSCRGLIFWYGSLGAREHLRDELMAAARALAADFDPNLGLVPWGSAFGGEREMARVDGVAGLVPLFGWATQGSHSPELALAGERHLSRHLELCFVDGTVHPALVRSEGSWLPQPPPGAGWSRGWAWLLLSCVDAAQWLAPGFTEPAVQLAEVWLRRFPGTVPLADLEHPDGPVDSSATAIVSVALLKLSAVTADDRWWRTGESMLRDMLALGQATAGPGRGAVCHGCYDPAFRVAADHELVWGDFFSGIGLGMLTGLLGVTGV